MKQRGMIGLVRVMTLISIIVIGIGAAPTLLLGPLRETQAKVAMQDIRYSGPRASMAVNANNIYLTWWDNKTGNNEVYFGASNDSGKSFGKPINLSDDNGGSADSQIAATPNNVYVTWWDNSTGNWQVFSRSSNDTGKTFGNTVMIKAVGSTPVKHLNAPLPNTTSVDTIVAGVIGNKEYVVWWDNSTGNWEVFLAKSTDGGKTFDSPINISNTPDARSVGARMIAQGNNVYIAWMDIKPGQKQVIFRASNDSGQTFDNPIVVYDGSSGSAGGTTAPSSSSSSSPSNAQSSATGVPGLP
jgi:hypothetical protein